MLQFMELYCHKFYYSQQFFQSCILCPQREFGEYGTRGRRRYPLKIKKIVDTAEGKKPNDDVPIGNFLSIDFEVETLEPPTESNNQDSDKIQIKYSNGL